MGHFNSTVVYLKSILSGNHAMSELSEPEERVFLPFFGRLGDMIMFLDMLTEYKKVYREKGIPVLLGCRNEVWKLLEDIDLADGMIHMELSREKLVISSDYYVSRVKEAKAFSPSIILHVRENSAGEHALIHAVPARRKFIFRSFPIIYHNPLAKYLSTHTYTDDWIASEGMDQLSCYGEMLRRIGVEGYLSKVYRLPVLPLDFSELPEAYIAVCPGASGVKKCWPAQRYAKIIDYIVDCFGIKLVLCGGKGDIQISDEIFSNVQNKHMLYDMTGKTSLSAWIGMIQRAKMVITNESASVHIAAASRVPSVCVGEQQFGDMWLPYRPEEVYPEDCLPVIVRGPTLPCTFCAKQNFKRSIECQKCLQKTGVLQCVYEVTEEMVIEAVDQVLGRLKDSETGKLG